MVNTTYTVAPNNWSSEVNRVLSSKTEEGANQIQYPVYFGNEKDPAPGCKKMFTSTYKCGTDSTSTKTITIPAEAYGKFATYDCQEEALRCLNNRLTLLDSGSLIASTGDGAVIWKSRAAVPSSAETVPEFMATSTPIGRSFLTQGETISAGQILGSPSGKCALRVNPTNPKEIQILYRVNNSQEIDGKKIGGKGTPITIAAYSTGSGGGIGTGKIGHVDMNGVLHEYPESMMKLSKTFEKVGNFTTEGANLEYMDGVSSSLCEEYCGLNEKCTAFEFSSNSCKLKGSGAYPEGPRTADEETTLYVRKRTLEHDHTCSGEPQIITSSEWANYPKGKEMTKDTLCGFAEMNKEEMEELDSLQKDLDRLLKEIKVEIKKVNDTESAIEKDLEKSQVKLAEDIAEYQKLHEKYGSAKKASTAYAGRIQSTNYQSVMEQSYFMIWASVAALATFGAAYFFRKRNIS